MHKRPRIKRFSTAHGPGLLYSTVVLFLSLTSASAQLPFYTDDADTTARGKFHLEISNQHDWLQKDSVNAPFIKLFNDRSSNPGNPSGIGDTQIGVKSQAVAYDFR